jgi:hypothetical protein
MRNVHVLPTDKPRMLFLSKRNHLQFLKDNPSLNPNNHYNYFEGTYQNIYITSDEEIKDVRPHRGRWQLEKGHILNQFPNYLTDLSECKLVIMTTDQDLIADGVQAIDNEFLEWFVKNPSCESVEVRDIKTIPALQLTGNNHLCYKIIIPKEETTEEAIQRAKNYMRLKGALEPKQETLEEASHTAWLNYEYVEGNLYSTSFKNGFKFGAKWQQERMYSEEDMAESFMACWKANVFDGIECKLSFIEWFEQFKKK